MSQSISAYPFRGGLDTTTAALLTSPSYAIAAMNYEPLAEGYGRIQGYERFDGRPAPSAAKFWSVDFNVGGTEVEVGDTVEGQSSGATAIVAMAPVLASGAWLNNTAAGELILTELTGTFEAGENLMLGLSVVANTTDEPRLFGSSSPEDRQDRLAAAQAWYRGAIQKVPGEGPVRGVAIHGSDVFAWRNNVGSSAGVMYRSTTSGWVAVNLGRRLNFTAGLVEINEGDAIVGATSGATATVARLVRRTGNWGSDAEGYIILSGLTGAFTSETLKVGATNVATVTADVAMTLPPGGQYEAISHNFYGNPSRDALYAVNGVGNAFEFCNGVFCPIETGTPTDTPTHIAEIAQHLVMAFPAGSVQHSAAGEPLIFDVVQGAGEFGFGTEITNLIQSNESAIAIFGQKKIGVFSGRDVDTFQLAELTEEAGAYAWTAQRMGQTVYMDLRGLRDLRATQAFGNFKTGAISAMFDRYLSRKLGANQIPVGSIVSRLKSQYRVFWADGTGLSIFMGGKAPEALPFSLGGLVPFCLTSGDIGTEEFLLVGGQDGYVYRLDRGNTFDGNAFDFYIVTPFNHFGNAVQEDRFHKVAIEMIAPNYTDIGIAAMFDYGDGEKVSSLSQSSVVYGDGGLWNAVNYNEFVWSSSVEGWAEAPIDGIGRNASFIFYGETQSQQDPHVLQAYVVYRSPRKFKR